jgi:hypothetical protein
VHESRRIRKRPSTADLFYLATAPLKSTDDAIERLQTIGVRPLTQ